MERDGERGRGRARGGWQAWIGREGEREGEGERDGEPEWGEGECREKVRMRG